MIELTTIMEQLTGQALTNSLIEFLEQHCGDFPEIHGKYQEAIARTEEGKTLAEAIDAQTASDLLFSAMLGMKANLDHFRDPIARTFLEVDPEIYLRETVAHSLPQYLEAQNVRNTIDANDDIINYATYLETFGPKLAHYWGYMLGNGLYSHIIPGFREDQRLTDAYRHMLEEYLEIRIL